MSGKFNKFKIIWLYLALGQVLPHALNLHETSPGLKPDKFHYNFFKKALGLKPDINFFT